MTQHLDDYRCSAEVRGSFQETAPRKNAENTVKHCDGGAGLMVANHHNGGESSVVVTTLVGWKEGHPVHKITRSTPAVIFSKRWRKITHGRNRLTRLHPEKPWLLNGRSK